MPSCRLSILSPYLSSLPLPHCPFKYLTPFRSRLPKLKSQEPSCIPPFSFSLRTVNPCMWLCLQKSVTSVFPPCPRCHPIFSPQRPRDNLLSGFLLLLHTTGRGYFKHKNEVTSHTCLIPKQKLHSLPGLPYKALCDVALGSHHRPCRHCAPARLTLALSLPDAKLSLELLCSSPSLECPHLPPLTSQPAQNLSTGSLIQVSVQTSPSQ